MTEFTTFFLAVIIAGAVFMLVVAFGCKICSHPFDKKNNSVEPLTCKIERLRAAAVLQHEARN
jgi:hypothetical protein